MKSLPKFKAGDKVRRIKQASPSERQYMPLDSEWVIESITDDGKDVRLVNDPYPYLSGPGHYPWASKYFQLVEESKKVFYVVLRNKKGNFNMANLADILAKEGLEMDVSDYYTIAPTIDRKSVYWRYSIEPPQGMVVRAL